MQDEKTFSRNIDITTKEYKSNLQTQTTANMAKLKKAGEGLYNLMLKFDMFGKPINLRYNGNDNFKSIIGATLSLACIGLILVFLSYSLGVFLGRQAPSYSSLTENKSIPADIDLTKTFEPMDWVIGVDIFDASQTSVMDPTVFTVKVQKTVVELNVEQPPMESISVPCTNSSAFNTKVQNLPTSASAELKNSTYYNLFKMADKTGHETAKCFLLNYVTADDGSIVPSVLSGTTTSESQQYMSIKIDICRNGTDPKIICKSLDVIQNKLDYYNVRFYFTQHAFVKNDTQQNSVVNSTAFYQFPIQKYFSKKYDLHVQKNTVVDSWNLLSTSTTTQYIFTYSSQDINIDFIQQGIDPTKSLLVINIMLDTFSNTYIRRFVNIKDFFIGIVGILNGIWAGGMGFGRFLNGMLLKVDLINKSFFVLENEATGKPKSQVEPLGQKPIGEMTFINKMENVEQQNDNKSNIGLVKEKELEVPLHRINTISEKGKEKEDTIYRGGSIVNPYYNDPEMLLPTKNKKFNKFKMSFLELMMKLMPCLKSKSLIVKRKIFEDCGAIIEAFFDIERIVAILREYQDLRNVVLSPEEYAILKQLTTPKVEIEDDQVIIKKVDKIAMTEKQLKQSYNKFVQSINRMIKMPYITPIENNLLEIHRISLITANK